MSKIGFIGTGSMGQILIDAFIRSGALQPENVIVYNRTRQKAEQVASRHSGVTVAPNNNELVQVSHLFFLCVKPSDYGRVLDEIHAAVRPDHLVVTITSPVSIADVSSQVSGKVAKVIPSITNAVHSGTSLVMFGPRLTPTDREQLLSLFRAISQPVEIDERHVRVASDLASCGPAFLSYIAEQLVRAAVQVTQLPEETACSLVSHMIFGTGKLLTEGHFTLASLQKRVAVPGGVTREGIDFLEKGIGTVFHELLQLTQKKHVTDRERVSQLLQGKR